MCEVFDGSWKTILSALVFFSIFTLLLRIKYPSTVSSAHSARPPAWLPLLVFWGSGIVGVTMLALMVLGFVCAGSPGDIDGIVPN